MFVLLLPIKRGLIFNVFIASMTYYLKKVMACHEKYILHMWSKKMFTAINHQLLRIKFNHNVKNGAIFCIQPHGLVIQKMKFMSN